MMTAATARKLDEKGTFYVDWDDVSGAHGVFGTESGFCYATFSDKDEAEVEAARYRRKT